MPTQVFNSTKRDVLAAFLASMTSPRIALLMTNTTADTENDGIVFLSHFTTLDEFDGANYVRKTLAGGTAAIDDANDRGSLDFDNVVWTALGAGTRPILGVLFYDHVGAEGANKSPVFLEFPTTKTPDGSDFTLNINELLRAA